jgi:hypothetical protein
MASRKIRTSKIEKSNYLWRIAYVYQGLWGARLGSIRLGMVRLGWVRLGKVRLHLVRLGSDRLESFLKIYFLRQNAIGTYAIGS